MSSSDLNRRNKGMDVQKIIKRRHERKAIQKKEYKEYRAKKDLNRMAIAISMSSEKFYRTREWKEFRYKILSVRGNRCECCGRGPKEKAIIQVDHIFPRFTFPEKAFDPDNMQVLCSDCNEGKGIKDKTRWSNIK